MRNPDDEPYPMHSDLCPAYFGEDKACKCGLRTLETERDSLKVEVEASRRLLADQERRRVACDRIAEEREALRAEVERLRKVRDAAEVFRRGWISAQFVRCEGVTSEALDAAWNAVCAALVEAWRALREGGAS